MDRKYIFAWIVCNFVNDFCCVKYFCDGQANSRHGISHSIQPLRILDVDEREPSIIFKHANTIQTADGKSFGSGQDPGRSHYSLCENYGHFVADTGL